MEVKAPAGLDEDDLIQYIRVNCLANFKIDTYELDYDDGFAEIENYFDAESSAKAEERSFNWDLHLFFLRHLH